MKDYSNHYPSSKQLMYENGKSLFLKQTQGFEGFDVLIDGNSHKVIIQQHKNPMNEEKEDRLLLCLDDVIIHRGSVVFYENTNWLVTTDVDFNGIYKSCRIVKTNHILKLYNPLSKLISVPVIAENKTLWTLGVSESQSSPIITGDAKLNITMPDSEETRFVDRDARLICDDMPFKVTIKSTLKHGLVTLVCGEDTLIDGDNVEQQIAKNPYLPITITFPQTQYTISQNSNLTLTPTVKQGDKTLLLSDFPVVWSVDNTTVANVNNGVVSGIGVGICKVRCSLVGNSDVWSEVGIEVSSNIINPTILCSIEGSNTIRKTATNTYQAFIINDGIKQSNKTFDFSISNYTGVDPSLITLTLIDGYTCKIKSMATSGTIQLLTTNKEDSSLHNYMSIELKGLYG